MSLLSGSGSTNPNNFKFYDVSIASFTVAAAAAASPYEVTGSRRSYPVNSTINAALPAGAWNITFTQNVLYGRCTTTSTDTYNMVMQWSRDGGTTWVSLVGLSTAFGGGAGGLNVADMDEIGQQAIAVTFPITNATFLIRLAVTDATSPTTDAFTLTNIRCTSQLILPSS